jgi:hypothetical protein
MGNEDYDDIDEQDDNNSDEPGWRKKLQREAKQGREAVKAANDAQKELAFYKAGLPMGDPRMAYFVKGYDGEFSAEAIRKAASDAGFIEQSAADHAVTDEVSQYGTVSAASAGASTAGRLSQSEVVALARKAADAGPIHMAAQIYADTLTSHGFTHIQQAPAR